MTTARFQARRRRRRRRGCRQYGSFGLELAATRSYARNMKPDTKNPMASRAQLEKGFCGLPHRQMRN